MSFNQFVWCKPLGRLGDRLIDLTKCIRFIARPYEGTPGRNGILYYLTGYHLNGENQPEPRHVWIRCVDGEEVNEDTMRYEYFEVHEECHPQEVAHQLLKNRSYGDRLPENLEQYRRFGDADVYREWEAENGGPRALKSMPPRPVWSGPAPGSRCLTLGNILCKRFAREAPDQFKVLDALEAQGWTTTVRSPFGPDGRDRLEQTVKAMNRWVGSPISFRAADGWVSWSPRRNPASTPKFHKYT